jgi:hypothetical protein
MPKTTVKIIDGFNTIEYDKCSIYIIENIVDDNFCNDIIKLIETLPLKKIQHEEYNNVECFIAYSNELLKEDDDFYYEFPTQNDNHISLISNQLPITNNRLNGITNEELRRHIDNINDKIIIISKIMKEINSKISFEYNSGYNLRKIYGTTKRHIDGIIDIIKDDVNFINKENVIENYNMVRNASMIFALNDDYDGGEFHFPYQDIYVRMKKGSVVIFPPYWTHPHEVSSVENNTYRYTINTWPLELLKN